MELTTKKKKETAGCCWIKHFFKENLLTEKNQGNVIGEKED